MRARLSHYSGFVRSVSTKKLLICGLPLPTAHRQATHIHIYTHTHAHTHKHSQMEPQAKSRRNYAKTNQANENITASKSSQDAQTNCAGVGARRVEGEGWGGVALTVVWVPQMLCLIGISWVLSCCSLAPLNVVLVLVFIFVCVLAA